MTIAFASLSAFLIGALSVWLFLSRRFRKEARDADMALKEAVAVSDALREELGKVSASLQVEQAKSGMLEKSLETFKAEREKEAGMLSMVFKNSAAEILKAKSEELASVNSEQIRNLLDPLGRKMEEFRRAVEDTREKSLKNTVAIEQQIKNMMEQTITVGREANNLASALRSNNKVVGNWGEVVLENLLEGMGLRKDEDYVLQYTIRDSDGNAVLNEDTGRKLVPDVVLYLPDNKAIVIDSKVSLDAYVDYAGASDDTSRTAALSAHRKSVEAHVRELAAKNYGRYIKMAGRDSLGYTVMFIPNEGAFQLYYQNFREDWHKAFDRGIIISGESNLFAMLKIIDNTWVRVRQQKNIEEVMKIASELVERVVRFANTFDEVGDVLSKALAKFEDARRSLSGRVSVVTSARKLEKKGVPVRENFRSALMEHNDQEDN